MYPADKSFAVHLDSLLGFAQELTTQVHGITKPSGELEGLLSAPVLFGAFNEADSLAATHAAAVAEMHALLADVQEALSFANDVTKTVADGYRKIDSDLGAYLGSDGVLNGGSGTDPSSGAAGPSTGLNAGPVAVGARPDGQAGLQLSIAGTTVTAGVDGVHIDTSDPSTGASTAIDVPVAGTAAGAVAGTAAGAVADVGSVAGSVPGLDGVLAQPGPLPVDPVTGV